MNKGIFQRPFKVGDRFNYIVYDYEKTSDDAMLTIDWAYEGVYVFCKDDNSFRKLIAAHFNMQQLNPLKNVHEIIHVPNCRVSTISPMILNWTSHQCHDIIRRCGLYIFKCNRPDEVYRHFVDNVEILYPDINVYLPKLIETKLFLCSLFKNVKNDTEVEISRLFKFKKIENTIGNFFFDTMGNYLYDASNGITHNFVDNKKAVLKNTPIISIDTSFTNKTNKFHPTNEIYAMSIYIKTKHGYFNHILLVCQDSFTYSDNVANNVMVTLFKSEFDLLQCFHKYYILGDLFRWFIKSNHILVGPHVFKDSIAICERFAYLRMDSLQDVVVDSLGNVLLNKYAIYIEMDDFPSTTNRFKYIDTYLKDLFNCKQVIENYSTCENGTIKIDVRSIKISSMHRYNKNEVNVTFEFPRGVIKRLLDGFEKFCKVKFEKFIDKCIDESNLNCISMCSLKSNYREHGLLANGLLKYKTFIIPINYIPKFTTDIDGKLVHVYDDLRNRTTKCISPVYENVTLVLLKNLESAVVEMFNISYNNVAIVDLDFYNQHVYKYRKAFFNFLHKDQVIIIFKEAIPFNNLGVYGEMLPVTRNVIDILKMHITDCLERYLTGESYNLEQIQPTFNNTNWIALKSVLQRKDEYPFGKLKISMVDAKLVIVDNNVPFYKFKNNSFTSRIIDTNISMHEYKLMMTYYQYKKVAGMTPPSQLTSERDFIALVSNVNMDRLLTCTLPSDCKVVHLLRKLYSFVLS